MTTNTPQQEQRAFPRPWKFLWQTVPMIIDANGKTVCILSTGTIEGAYTSESIIELANQFLAPNQPQPAAPDWKEALQAAADKEEIFEPKYGGKDHSGYQSIHLYEVNDHRSECFKKGAEWAKDFLTRAAQDQPENKEA